MSRVWVASIAAVILAWNVAASPVTLKKEAFRDKCMGAWAGQMIGVCFGEPYEFRSNGKPITGPIREWTPERVSNALNEDDCYVEMTFLKALEANGLNVTFEQAGKAFGESQYELWHANRAGRDNIRKGILPPASGNPANNTHADDIDFQIEADLFGILCPGLPEESNRLCDVFGHIMNYGDGVYGGMYIAGMYSAAYFESVDVAKVIEAGLACIPKQSTYYQCIRDVVNWHKENPKDWLAVWNKIEAKWQDNVDCAPDKPFNIDAKLNGAYVTLGLLFGEGDLRRTMEYAVRCGQDADCNPSNAAGILGCMKGFKSLDAGLTGGIAAIKDKNFSYTSYSFDSLIPACERITAQVVKRAGGEVRDDAYVFTLQAPKAPATLEQWNAAEKKKAIGGSASADISAWNGQWKVIDGAASVKSARGDRKNVLALPAASQGKNVSVGAEYQVPQGAAPKMTVDISTDDGETYQIRIVVNEDQALLQSVNTKGAWTTLNADLAEYAGRTVTVRIEATALEGAKGAVYLGSVELQ